MINVELEYMSYSVKICCKSHNLNNSFENFIRKSHILWWWSFFKYLLSSFSQIQSYILRLNSCHFNVRSVPSPHISTCSSKSRDHFIRKNVKLLRLPSKFVITLKKKIFVTSKILDFIKFLVLYWFCIPCAQILYILSKNVWQDLIWKCWLSLTVTNW